MTLPLACSLGWGARITGRMMDPTLLEETLRQRLASNVRALRNAAGLTLKAASERADLHWRHWQKIEAGAISTTMDTLEKVAQALNVDAQRLLRKPEPSRTH